MVEDVERVKRRAAELHARVTAAYDELTDTTGHLSIAVRALHHDYGMTYADIAAVLGVSKARAYQLAGQGKARTASSG